MTKRDAVMALDFCRDQEGQLLAAIEGSKDAEYIAAMRVVLKNVKDKMAQLETFEVANERS
jgi:hypothetical protein